MYRKKDTEIITFRVSKEDKRAFQKLCWEQDMSISQALRGVVKQARKVESGQKNTPKGVVCPNGG